MRRIALLSCVGLALAACGDDGAPADADATTSGTSNGEDPGTTTGLDGSTDVDFSQEPDTSSSSGEEPEPPPPLPPLDDAPTTLDERIVPTHVIESRPTLDPRVPEQRTQLLDEGYGDYDLDPGEAIMPITPAGRPVPEPGPGAALVSRFVHLADTQIADDESPLRLIGVDSLFIAGGFRPQESYGCMTTNAAVRTINAVHAETPLDFVVLGGDNADSAQQNEVQWFLDILDGAPVVHCDSGDDDDPEPGESNDPKDPIAPVGLDVPWIWVTGNHDVLNQGSLPIEPLLEDAVGSNVPGGNSSRDWSQPGGPVFDGPVVPDPARALVAGTELLTQVSLSGDGHGITKEIADTGVATYAWDVEGTELRMVVVDSTAGSGGALGLVTETQLEERIRPLLDQAETDGALVMISTHHCSNSLADGSGLGVSPAPDPLEPEDWQAFLADYPNVLAHLCGHSHVHQAEYIQPIGTRGYWEIITAAIADWPHQMRIVELHDQDNGWYTLTGIAFDLSTEGDPLAEQGRALGILDFTSGWQLDGSGTPSDRNVELWIEAP